MKKYIEPTTQMTEARMTSCIMQISFGVSTEGGDPWTGADAPLRNFNGDKQSLKYLI